jgi:hypothetical protein
MASGLEDVFTQHGFAQIFYYTGRWVLDYGICAFMNISYSENHKMTDYHSFWFVAQREARQQQDGR